MHPINLFELLKQVITSWQVIAVTIALLIFLKIVFNTASSYRRPKAAKKLSIKKKSKPKETVVIENEGAEDSIPNDDLGLEES